MLVLGYVMKAYIFINSDPGILWQLTEAVLKIEGVKMAHAVTGQFDVVAYAELANMDGLRHIIDTVRSLKGVQRTQTAVAIPPRLE